MIDARSLCMTRNANYERVLTVLGKYLSERYSHSCGCVRCVSDIAAIALNTLPPHYYVEAGNGEIAGSPWVMVEHAVAEAIERVMESPRHKAPEPGRRTVRAVEAHAGHSGPQGASGNEITELVEFFRPCRT